MGIPDYTPDNHMKMSQKRHRKIQCALEDLPSPEVYAPDGPLDVGVIAWGSTFGSALEAVQGAQEKGLKTGALKIKTLFPYHADEIRAFMDRCEEILIPELNYEGQLANLIELDLGGNRFSEVPAPIGHLSSLQRLWLNNNNLETVPPELGQLSHLEGLSLRHNQLAELPPELGQLSNLKVLEIAGNRLTKLPPEIEQLPGLKIIRR